MFASAYYKLRITYKSIYCIGAHNNLKTVIKVLCLYDLYDYKVIKHIWF